MKTRLIGGRFNNSSGQVAVLFALALLPIMAVVGLAVDSARLVSAEQHLQRAIDAAALAGSKDVRGNEDDLAYVEGQIERVFFANLLTSHADLDCAVPSIEINITNRTVQVGSECDLPTLFGRTISGQQTMEIAEAASAKASYVDLEVVLMMDLSDSMSGDLDDAKAAAKDLTTQLMGTGTSEYVRISVVPYGSTVNAGIYGNRSMGRPDIDDSYGDGIDTVCMTDRTGAEAMTDAVPIMGQWLSENTDPLFDCHGPPLLPLSRNASTVSSTIDAMITDPRARTGGHLAIAWSWYALSPKWHSIWPSASRPADYDDDDTKKILVLMTDGSFNALWLGTDSIDPFAPYKIPHTIARDLCQRMKDDDILIYSVGFGISPPLIDASMSEAQVAEALSWDSFETLNECASHPELVYLPDTGDELREVYNEIATGLKSVALTN